MSKRSAKSRGTDKIEVKKKVSTEEEPETLSSSDAKSVDAAAGTRSSSEELIQVESSESSEEDEVPSAKTKKDEVPSAKTKKDEVLSSKTKKDKSESSVESSSGKKTSKKPTKKVTKIDKGRSKKKDIKAPKSTKGKKDTKGKDETLKDKRKRSAPKKEEDGNYGTIRVRMECVSMKTSFEMLNNISTEKCYFRFKEDGFYIAATNKPKEKQKKTDTRANQRSEIEFYFPSTALSYYKFGLLDSYSNPIQLHDTCVCTRTFHDQIRNLKKGNLVFKIDVNTTHATDKGFYIVNGRLKNHVPPLEGKNKYPRMKKFSEYYTKAIPRARPVNSELDSKMVAAKNGRCEEIEFKHFTRSKNTTMFGYNAVSDDPVVTYEFENKDDNSSMEEDTTSDAFLLRTIRTDGCDWIYKICKLSNGVLEIYIHDQEHAPLGFRTSVGSQGTVTMTVQSI